MSHFETRSYVVGDDFWRSIDYPFANQSKADDERRSRDFEDFLRHAGVPFPDGSFVQLDRSKNVITMRNSRIELDHVETLIGPMDGQGKFYIKKKEAEGCNSPGQRGQSDKQETRF